MADKRILLIEPYFGGSHRQFIEGMMSHIPAHFTLLSLPARKWKMRMQISAPWFVGKVREMKLAERGFDCVILSTFVDVAVFRALVERVEGWNPECRYLTYFHENQFHYPGLKPKETNQQFTSINFTTALVSDGLAFNSLYNKTTFLRQCRKYTGKAVDMNIGEEVDKIENKSLVLYPGMEFSAIDKQEKSIGKEWYPLIIWNHRWEHDKNPEEFFQVLFKLQEEAIPFRLAILGQSFRNQPECFEIAKKRLENNIIHFGHVSQKSDYYHMLAQGDIVVSTAFHEFFGIAVLEAVRAGCIPLLPERLSYPELFESKYLYKQGHLFRDLKKLLLRKPVLPLEKCKIMTDKFSWESLTGQYKKWLEICED